MVDFNFSGTLDRVEFLRLMRSQKAVVVQALSLVSSGFVAQVSTRRRT